MSASIPEEVSFPAPILQKAQLEFLSLSFNSELTNLANNKIYTAKI